MFLDFLLFTSYKLQLYPKNREITQLKSTFSLGLLDKIQSVGGETYILDVKKYGFESDSSLKNVFDKLLNSIQDLKQEEKTGLDFPISKIAEVFQTAEKQRVKLGAMMNVDFDGKNIDLKDLTEKVSEINWKDSFELKDLQVLMPPTPGVKINTNSKTALSKSKFLLEEDQQKPKINLDPASIKK